MLRPFGHQLYVDLHTIRKHGSSDLPVCGPAKKCEYQALANRDKKDERPQR